jgi:hypothetical protein
MKRKLRHEILNEIDKFRTGPKLRIIETRREKNLKERKGKERKGKERKGNWCRTEFLISPLSWKVFSWLKFVQ